MVPGEAVGGYVSGTPLTVVDGGGGVGRDIIVVDDLQYPHTPVDKHVPGLVTPKQGLSWQDAPVSGSNAKDEHTPLAGHQ